MYTGLYDGKVTGRPLEPIGGLAAGPKGERMGTNLTYKILQEHLVEGDLLPGEEIGIRIDQCLTQDATGGRTVTWPASVLSPPEVLDGANNVTVATFLYDGTSYRELVPKSKSFIGPFTYTDLPANTANFPLLIPTIQSGAVVGFNAQGMTMPRAGRVIGITISAQSARTGGTATFTASKNATQGTLSAVLDAANPQFVTATQKSGDTYAAGDRLTIRGDTDVGWLPITAEIVAWLEVIDT